jgi:hypothetical protein
MQLKRSTTHRALNPRFLRPLFGQETGFRTHVNEIKSGIPCSDNTVVGNSSANLDESSDHGLRGHLMRV